MKNSAIARLRIPASLIFSLVLVHALAHGQEKTESATKPSAAEAVKCPVSGDPANLAISTPTREGPVFFCKAECAEQFRKAVDRFAQPVAAQRAALASLPKVQVKCPVSGDPADPKITQGPEGQKVSFCSEDCRKKYASEPARYAAALANSYSYQTKCPVMKELINPKSYIKLPSGQTVYFCCKGCDEKLVADPAKYAGVLKEQGFTFDFSKPK